MCKKELSPEQIEALRIERNAKRKEYYYANRDMILKKKRDNRVHIPRGKAKLTKEQLLASLTELKEELVIAEKEIDFVPRLRTTYKRRVLTPSMDIELTSVNEVSSALYQDAGAVRILSFIDLIGIPRLDVFITKPIIDKMIKQNIPRKAYTLSVPSLYKDLKIRIQYIECREVVKVVFYKGESYINYSRHVVEFSVREYCQFLNDINDLIDDTKSFKLSSRKYVKKCLRCGDVCTIDSYGLKKHGVEKIPAERLRWSDGYCVSCRRILQHDLYKARKANGLHKPQVARDKKYTKRSVILKKMRDTQKYIELSDKKK